MCIHVWAPALETEFMATVLKMLLNEVRCILAVENTVLLEENEHAMITPKPTIYIPGQVYMYILY